ncbi:MAG: leucine-rich repeat protein [Lachnospiraceae bacterium]
MWRRKWIAWAKSITAVLLILLITGFVSRDDHSSNAVAATIESAFSFDAASNTITGFAAGYSGTALGGVLEIPETIGGVEVKNIGANAFQNQGLTSVTFESALTTIGEYAFADNSLTSVMIPGSIYEISRGSFQNNQLKDLTILDGVEIVGDDAFMNNQLTVLQLPGSVRRLQMYSFASNQIHTVVIADGIMPLEFSTPAFENNSDLREFIYPKSRMVYIGAGSFYYTDPATGALVEYLPMAVIRPGTSDSVNGSMLPNYTNYNWSSDRLHESGLSDPVYNMYRNQDVLLVDLSDDPEVHFADGTSALYGKSFLTKTEMVDFLYKEENIPIKNGYVFTGWNIPEVDKTDVPFYDWNTAIQTEQLPGNGFRYFQLDAGVYKEYLIYDLSGIEPVFRKIGTDVQIYSSDSLYSNTISDILKDPSGIKGLLAGVSYEIYAEGESSPVTFRLEEGKYVFDPSGTITAITTDLLGAATLSQLWADTTYFLREVSVPTGYYSGKGQFDSFTVSDTEIVYLLAEEMIRGAKFRKVDAEDQSKVLQGAEFELYNEEKEKLSGFTEITVKGIRFFYYDSQGTDPLITDTEGGLCVINLPSGSYFLKEVNAPAGYSLSAEEFPFSLDKERSGAAVRDFGTIINTKKTITETVSKTVTILWVDEDDRDEIRPDSVLVQLYYSVNGNTQTYGDAVIVTAANNWTYTWSSLSAFEGDLQVTYAVKQVAVPSKYKITYSEDTFTITNTHTIKKTTIVSDITTTVSQTEQAEGDLPLTDDESYPTVFTILFILSGILLIGIPWTVIIVGRRNHRKS